MNQDPALAAFVTDNRSLLDKALSASRSGVAVKLIEFDGSGDRLRGVPLALRVLNAEESVRVRADAVKWLTRECGFTDDFLIGTTDGTAIIEFEVKARTIALALVDPSNPAKTVARNVDNLRTALDADEISSLFEIYVDWLQERSPITTARTAEEVTALIEALGKGTMPLSRLSTFDASTVRTITRELVSRLRSLTSSPSSPTPPSSDEAPPPPEPSDSSTDD